MKDPNMNMGRTFEALNAPKRADSTTTTILDIPLDRLLSLHEALLRTEHKLGEITRKMVGASPLPVPEKPKEFDPTTQIMQMNEHIDKCFNVIDTINLYINFLGSD